MLVAQKAQAKSKVEDFMKHPIHFIPADNNIPKIGILSKDFAQGGEKYAPNRRQRDQTGGPPACGGRWVTKQRKI